jgi:hypothetical protein
MPIAFSKKYQKIPKWREDPRQIEKYQFIHHFVPHPFYQSRARLLSMKALHAYCLIFLTILVGFKLFVRFYPGVLGYASNINVEELMKLSNQKRSETGLSQLRLNPALTAAAQEKAKDMFKNDYWAHVSPEGKEPWDFILAQNYDYTYAGENLAKNFSNSEDVVDAWYNSPSHKENLLNKNYDEVGLAVVDGVLNGYETTLVVQMFGRPRDINHLATVDDEAKIISNASQQTAQAALGSVSESEPQAVNLPALQKESKLPALDVSLAVKTISVMFLLFLISLLLLDIWYSRRHSIAKVSGHTFAHLMFLIVSLVGVLFAILPGKIL